MIFLALLFEMVCGDSVSLGGVMVLLYQSFCSRALFLPSVYFKDGILRKRSIWILVLNEQKIQHTRIFDETLKSDRVPAITVWSSMPRRICVCVCVQQASRFPFHFRMDAINELPSPLLYTMYANAVCYCALPERPSCEDTFYTLFLSFFFRGPFA